MYLCLPILLRPFSSAKKHVLKEKKKNRYLYSILSKDFPKGKENSKETREGSIISPAKKRILKEKKKNRYLYSILSKDFPKEKFKRKIREKNR